MREMILTITSVLLVAASTTAQPRVEKNVV
jgi:hypothetical protein